jgi:hypothetical protein
MMKRPGYVVQARMFLRGIYSLSSLSTPLPGYLDMIVAFGPTHDSYFIAHGVRYYAEKLPRSLQAKLYVAHAIDG